MYIVFASAGPPVLPRLLSRHGEARYLASEGGDPLVELLEVIGAKVSWISWFFYDWWIFDSARKNLVFSDQ